MVTKLQKATLFPIQFVDDPPLQELLEMVIEEVQEL